jgi:hypothetical protein
MQANRPIHNLQLAIQLTLALCGMALLLASFSIRTAAATQWWLRIIGMLLMMPAVIRMLLSMPLRAKDPIQDEDD